MNSSSPVQMKLDCPASVALQRIAEATTKEGLPFLSPFDPRDKPFLSRVDDAAFRIWKWPSYARGRNQLVPVLHAEVIETESGSLLTGSFRLHPFSRMLPWFTAAVMLALSGLIWMQGGGRQTTVVTILLLLLFVSASLFAFRKRKAQLRDENQVLEFLQNVLANVG